MARNIVICSDGTGNTFDAGISNVTRLIRVLALDDHAKQVVVYDQGIGTNAARVDAVRFNATNVGVARSRQGWSDDQAEE